MKFVAIWLFGAGAVLLGLGFLAEITAPPHSGADIGGAAAFAFGMCCTGLGLAAGVVAAVTWRRVPKDERRHAVPLLPWEHRLRRLTVAAVILIAAGAVLQSAGIIWLLQQTVHFDRLGAYAIYFVGLGSSVLGLLAGIPYAAFWLSWRRTAAHLRLSGRA
ncbi:MULTISPECIES: hypothetical protein [Amycolatopsis]|uniref:DUF2975 domain-containing protein n=1 Tax=Amycolatopsis albidoflavus TaxID=102226 RepID=A0ABW5HXB8_9PSEU